MKHAMPHDLDRAVARKAAEKAFESYSERFSKYNPWIEWESDYHAKVGFSAKGVGLDGTMDIEPNTVIFALDVPFIFKVFRKKAVDIIDEEFNKWLQRARDGEFDEE